MPTRDRLIIDTNLWITFLISKNFTRLDPFIFNRSTTLLFSQELLDEFIVVASRPKFRKHFSIQQLEQILQRIADGADFVEVKSVVGLCSDSKDNFPLSLAIDGKADYLITGDADLLDLKKIGQTTIVTLSDYLQNLL